MVLATLLAVQILVLTWQTTFSPATQSLPGMMVAVGAKQNWW